MKDKPQPISLTNIADMRAWHLAERIETKHFFDEDRRKLLCQFGDCLRLLDNERQSVLCNFAVRSVMRSNRYWGQDASRFADMIHDLYWDLNPNEARPLTPREARRLTV